MQNIVIAGGTGFLGRCLTVHFQRLGYVVTILTRSPGTSPPATHEFIWDARTPGPWAHALNGAVAVINLVGRSVNCRYNDRNREAILSSRVDSTHAIAHAIAQCEAPPPVWLNASTATIYRHTFGSAWGEDGEISADIAAKDRFSIQVATAWENAMRVIPTPCTRKIAMRTAMVLGCESNSVFPVLRRLARCGLGGKMAGGRQFVSWIHEADFCRALDWLITHTTLAGPVNIAAPNPVTNEQMMRVIRDICGVRFGLPAARWMLEVGAILLRTETELTLKSRRVIPQKLLTSGFDFRYPLLPGAVEDLEAKMAAKATR